MLRLLNMNGDLHTNRKVQMEDQVAEKNATQKIETW